MTGVAASPVGEALRLEYGLDLNSPVATPLRRCSRRLLRHFDTAKWLQIEPASYGTLRRTR